MQGLRAAFCTEPGILPTIDAPPDASAVLPGGRSRKLILLGGANYEVTHTAQCWPESWPEFKTLVEILRQNGGPRI